MFIQARGSLIAALLASVTLCCGTAYGDEEASRLDITGTLIKPPCTASFPTSQSVDIPKASLSVLSADSSEWTDVDLNFQCLKGSQVLLRFSAGNGSFDSNTLRTTLDRVGLKTRLSDMSSSGKAVDLTLGEQHAFAVEDTLLKLKLSVRPVRIGNQMPAVGSYSSTLLMEMIYQ